MIETPNNMNLVGSPAKLERLYFLLLGSTARTNKKYALQHQHDLHVASHGQTVTGNRRFPVPALLPSSPTSLGNPGCKTAFPSSQNSTRTRRNSSQFLSMPARLSMHPAPLTEKTSATSGGRLTLVITCNKRKRPLDKTSRSRLPPSCTSDNATKKHTEPARSRK